ncbi:Hypothetical predicted protein [Paramuricea clavata]|uniref:Uncharacterized protein n=1 Tax=Paramuricea clavata TaxID=317549 RepID=A0A6S7IDH8_PARCT|nr:Hypothetical predicted protein [Paramuricea clavata]
MGISMRQMKSPIMHHRQENRDEVKLPRKSDRLRIPDSYELSCNRLRSMHFKLHKKPELLNEYDQIIKEQLSSGIIEKVPEKKIKDREHKDRQDQTISRSCSMFYYDSIGIPCSLGRYRESLFDGCHSSPRARYATLSVDEESSRGIHSPTILPPDVWIATVSIYITVGAVLDHHLDRNKKRDADPVELIKKSIKEPEGSVTEEDESYTKSTVGTSARNEEKLVKVHGVGPTSKILSL